MMMGVSAPDRCEAELPGRHAMEQCDGVLVAAMSEYLPLRYVNVAPSENTSAAKFAPVPRATSGAR